MAEKGCNLPIVDNETMNESISSKCYAEKGIVRKSLKYLKSAIRFLFICCGCSSHLGHFSRLLSV